MGNFFTSPIIEVSKSDNSNISTPSGSSISNELEDPRSPTAEVKRTPLQEIQKNNHTNSTKATSDTPVIKRTTVTLRRKLLEKMHTSSSNEDETK